jgi:hypothetical protein
VVVLLIMFYLDALVLLIGAEINSEIEYEVLGVTRGSNNFRIIERAMSRGRSSSNKSPTTALANTIPDGSD